MSKFITLTLEGYLERKVIINFNHITSLLEHTAENLTAVGVNGGSWMVKESVNEILDLGKGEEHVTI